MSADNGYVYWVTMNDGSLPNNVVCAGMEPKSNKHLYIGRTRIRGNLVPGMIVPRDRCLYVMWRGRILAVKTYEVMVTKWNYQGLQWIPRSKGQISDRAVIGGQTDRREALFIARVKLPQGGLWVGYLHPGHTGCHVIVNGREVNVETYEILCHRSKPQALQYVYCPARDTPTPREVRMSVRL